LERSLLYGSPPGVVFLRIGNCTRETLRLLLLRNVGIIRQMKTDGRMVFIAE
jgi:predicted nuclease of predicted toxin-antitoxin system